MKKSLIVLVVTVLFSCSGSQKDEAGPLKKVVCADSFEQELFDSLGESYYVKMPGDCDTIVVTEEKQ